MVKMSSSALARRERNRRALELRAEGAPWSEVATTCGFNSVNHAIVTVGRFLKRQTRDDVELARFVHRERLESLLRVLYPLAMEPGQARDAARAARQPDPMPQHRALELMRRLLVDLAKLGGLYARPEQDASVGEQGETVGSVLVWQPSEEWLREYAKALQELPPEVQPRLIDQGDPGQPPC